MSDSQVIISGLEGKLSDEVLAVATKAVRHLNLSGLIDCVEIVFDDIEPGRQPWLSFNNPKYPVIWAHAGDLSELPAEQQYAWELSELKHNADNFETNSTAISRFIYHQLLVLRDLLDGSVVLQDDMPESLQQSWSISVDGRLQQMGFPGYSAAECRRRFYRKYSTTGVLLPIHWETFRELWDTEDVNIDILKDACSRLPII